MKRILLLIMIVCSCSVSETNKPDNPVVTTTTTTIVEMPTTTTTTIIEPEIIRTYMNMYSFTYMYWAVYTYIDNMQYYILYEYSYRYNILTVRKYKLDDKIFNTYNEVSYKTYTIIENVNLSNYKIREINLNDRTFTDEIKIIQIGTNLNDSGIQYIRTELLPSPILNKTDNVSDLIRAMYFLKDKHYINFYD